MCAIKKVNQIFYWMMTLPAIFWLFFAQPAWPATDFFAEKNFNKNTDVETTSTKTDSVLKNSIGKKVGQLQNPALDEISGLAAASDNSGHVWMINDGGSGAILYRVDATGKLVQTFNIANNNNRDWEDLAAFSWQKQAFILIADVGDNGANRAYIELVVLAEPTLSKQNNTRILPWKIQRLVYPQGIARDCEAIAVDKVADKIYLLSKRTKPAQLFSLSLSELMRPSSRTSSNKSPPITLHLEADLTELSHAPVQPKISSWFQFMANWPTAMAIDASQERAVILTYGFLYFFRREPSQTWPQALQAPLKIQPLTDLLQAESVSFIGDSSVWVTSEGQNAPIMSWTFPEKTGNQNK